MTQPELKLEDGICSPHLHWFNNDNKPCQCREFNNTQHLREHNQTQGNRITRTTPVFKQDDR